MSAARAHAHAPAEQPAPPSAPRRAARPTPPRPRLTVVAPMRGAAPRAPFVLLVGGLLTTGLGGLLFLHTALAEDSFRLHDLRVRSSALADREQALEQQIGVTASPQRLAGRATALGMVRNTNPAFIRTADGRILGVPKPGEKAAAAAAEPATTRAQAKARDKADKAAKADAKAAKARGRADHKTDKAASTSTDGTGTAGSAGAGR